MKPKILLVEDDLSLGFIIAEQLKIEGYKVVLATDGSEGLKKFNETEFHLCILDIMLPKKDGFSLAKDIRKINKKIPIFFLTAKSMTEDKIKGFNAGGDDYLTKPFSSDELSVRIKALLKRIDIHIDNEDYNEVKLGDYTYDKLNYNLKGPGFNKKLTKKEAQILMILKQLENQVVNRDFILNSVWGDNDYFKGRSLDVFITKLRKYLANDPKVNIENMHSIGFKLSIKE